MSTSDFSPGHRALLRSFANPKESQLAEITQLLFQSGSERFILVVPGDGLHLPCRIVWRKEHRIGVAHSVRQESHSAAIPRVDPSDRQYTNVARVWIGERNGELSDPVNGG